MIRTVFRAYVNILKLAKLIWQIISHHLHLSLFLLLATVPLIYNFTLTCVYTHGTTQYLASKNPWFAVEKVFSTRRVVASRVAFHDTSLDIPRHVSFPQDVDFQVTSHGIYTQRA